AAEDTLLEYHFEQFNHTTDDMVAWIHVTDSFTSGADLEIYMYYGNGGASDAQDEPATYPANYTAVYHLEEPSGTEGADSTENYDLTHNNTPTLGVAGKIHLGIGYTKASEESSTNGTLLDGGITQASMTMWVMQTDTWDSDSTPGEAILHKQNTAADRDFISTQWRTNGKIILRCIDGSDRQVDIETAKVSWTGGVWYHLTFVFDATNNFTKIYVNGSITDGGTTSTTLYAMAAGTYGNFQLGSYVEAAMYSNTRLDEV
ncbi:unnamed protein product, partial [marine sediment metagenome]